MSDAADDSVADLVATTEPGQRLHLLRFFGTALTWGLAGAVVSAIVRAAVLVGAPALGLFVSPVGTDEPLTAATIAELIAECAAAGLVIGAMLGSFLDGPHRGRGAVMWSLGGAATVAIGVGLTVVLIESTHGHASEELCTILAWACAGLFAGFVGFWRNRWTATGPVDEDEDEVDSCAEQPRIFWIRGTPAGRLIPVFGVAMVCVVASLVTPPSTAGWAVVAVGLLGLAVGCALVGQERRLAALERRLRKLTYPNGPDA